MAEKPAEPKPSRAKFDRNAYQREYMRKKRAAERAAKGSQMTGTLFRTMKTLVADALRDAITGSEAADALDAFVTEYLTDSYCDIVFDGGEAQCLIRVGPEVALVLRPQIHADAYEVIRSHAQRKDVETLIRGIDRLAADLADTRKKYERLLADAPDFAKP